MKNFSKKFRIPKEKELEEMSTEEVSHGRGGTGNISPDETQYADGEIVHESTPVGPHHGGRGGDGNVSAGVEGTRDDHDIVPDSAKREAPKPSPGHGVSTGRGGEGNIMTEEPKVQVHQGLADKLKEKLFHRKSRDT